MIQTDAQTLSRAGEAETGTTRLVPRIVGREAGGAHRSDPNPVLGLRRTSSSVLTMTQSISSAYFHIIQRLIFSSTLSCTSTVLPSAPTSFTGTIFLVPTLP